MEVEDCRALLLLLSILMVLEFFFGFVALHKQRNLKLLQLY